MATALPWLRRALMGLGAWLAAAGPAVADELAVNLGYGEVPAEQFEYQVLQLALEKSGAAYDISVAPAEMTEARMRRFIEQRDNDTVTVAWFGTSQAFEARMQAVYIPLRQGLLGHRLFLIEAAKQPVFDQVSSLDDLAELTALQGTGWADVAILERAGLKVSTTAQRANLYAMLAHGRGDYFPRGVGEAFAELARYGDRYPNLAVEESVLLVYPFAIFFFVNNGNDALHDALRRGLEKAHADGSYDRLFQQHFGDVLERARLGQRTRLDVANPFMTDAVADIPEKYWLDLGPGA